MEITYMVSKDVEKIFVGEKQRSWLFFYTMVISGLTLSDRKLLGFGNTKLDEWGNEIELEKEEIPVETINASEHIPPIEESKIKAAIIERLEQKKKNYFDILSTKPSVKISLVTDSIFKSKEIIKQWIEKN